MEFSVDCNPLCAIGIFPDELRCLSDGEVRVLAIKKVRNELHKYEKGTSERACLVQIGKSILNKNCRIISTKKMLSGIRGISQDCLENGINLNGSTIEVVDIFSRRFNGSIDPEDRSSAGLRFFYRSCNDGISVFKNGRMVEIINRKIIGCVPFGTRPYSILDDFIKSKFAITIEESKRSKNGHRYVDVQRMFDSKDKMGISIEDFPFNFWHYIFKDISLHGILLSADSNNRIFPEGKISGIIG